MNEKMIDKSKLSEITQMLNHGRMVRSFMLPKFIDLPESDWLVIPPGYKNNILWNIGHISTLADRVIFGYSELPTFFSRKEMKSFMKDTSPAIWTETLPIAKIKEFFLTYPNAIETAEREGKFVKFLAFPLGDHLYIDSTLDAVRFAVCHEGCHLGIISGIVKHIHQMS
ncbi:MAG: DinB family protein [Planctomycetota bacterium]